MPSLMKFLASLCQVCANVFNFLNQIIFLQQNKNNIQPQAIITELGPYKLLEMTTNSNMIGCHKYCLSCHETTENSYNSDGF